MVSQRASLSGLAEGVRLVRGARRPNTHSSSAPRASSPPPPTSRTYADETHEDTLAPYGGRSLHEQSHGESFLALVLNRFGPNGFYLLDEPEAALSTQNCLTLLRRVHEWSARASSS